MKKTLFAVLLAATAGILAISCVRTPNTVTTGSQPMGRALVGLPHLDAKALGKQAAILQSGTISLTISAYDMDSMVYYWNMDSIPNAPVLIGSIPAGYYRVFTARLLNSNGVITHVGSAMVDIQPDQLVQVYLKLYRVSSGSVEICIEVEDYPAPECAPRPVYCDSFTIWGQNCMPYTYWQQKIDSVTAVRGVYPSYSYFVGFCGFERIVGLTRYDTMPIDSVPTYQGVTMTFCSDSGWYPPPPTHRMYDTISLNSYTCIDTGYWRFRVDSVKNSMELQGRVYAWHWFSTPCSLSIRYSQGFKTANIVFYHDSTFYPPSPQPDTVVICDSLALSDSGSCLDSTAWLQQAYSECSNRNASLTSYTLVNACRVSKKAPKTYKGIRFTFCRKELIYN